MLVAKCHAFFFIIIRRSCVGGGDQTSRIVNLPDITAIILRVTRTAVFAVHQLIMTCDIFTLVNHVRLRGGCCEQDDTTHARTLAEKASKPKDVVEQNNWRRREMERLNYGWQEITWTKTTVAEDVCANETHGITCTCSLHWHTTSGLTRPVTRDDDKCYDTERVYTHTRSHTPCQRSCRRALARLKSVNGELAHARTLMSWDDACAHAQRTSSCYRTHAYTHSSVYAMPVTFHV